jgi:histidine triad (HIT) family protein
MRKVSMSETDCIFCKIANGDIPAEKLYEDDDVIAFDDINPGAPVHFLVVPRVHIPTLDDIKEEHASIVSKMIMVGVKLAREKGVDKEGYREVINCREAAGQEVMHVHMHILGGRTMRPMG